MEGIGRAKWLTAARRVLSDQGNIFVYGIHHHQCWIQCMMYELGYVYRRQIIWHYENGFAGYGKRSLNAYLRARPLVLQDRDEYIFHEIREPYKSQARLKAQDYRKTGRVWTPHPDGRMAGDIWACSRSWPGGDSAMRRSLTPRRNLCPSPVA